MLKYNEIFAKKNRPAGIMKTFKILVIDDEPSILTTYQHIFSSLDDNPLDSTADYLFNTGKVPSQKNTTFILSTFKQGLDGVNAVITSKKNNSLFAIAFIDMRMPPGIDGLETAKRIIEVDPDIEIVFVTAYKDRSRQEIAERIGKHRFFHLKKPFDPDEVIQLAETLTFKWNLVREREQLDREKEIFIQNMSHELRHPLQVILGVCNTILTCEMDETRKHQFIKDIESEAQRLSLLAENLTTTRELETPMILNKKDPVDLIHLVDQVIRLLISDAEKKGLVLERKGLQTKTIVKGDKNSLVQVLVNLVVNAINYTEKGEVFVILEQENKQIKVSVKDTGVGIPFAEQPSVFEKFYRVKKESLKVRGHGLGLGIARDIINAHGSILELSSQPGKGSQFFFYLPLIDLTQKNSPEMS